MMEKINITSFVRPQSGKEITKKIRRDGFIPAVVYSKDMNLPIKIPVTELKTLRAHHFSESNIIEIKVEDDSEHKELLSVIKDIQFHPITDQVNHIDFLRVSMKEKIKVKVPIVLKGEAKGTKEGGTLEHLLHELEIEAFPGDLPEELEVDVSEVDVGHSLHVKDLDFGDKIKILDSGDETIATVAAQVEETEDEDAEVEEAPATEPEVIKEKKDTEEAS
jgi:large subunit ribosomal protein L25